jgi:hypothetical protein
LVLLIAFSGISASSTVGPSAAVGARPWFSVKTGMLNTPELAGARTCIPRSRVRAKFRLLPRNSPKVRIVVWSMV